MIEKFKQRALNLRRAAYSLYYAYQDPRTPWYARAWTSLVVAYAFSPVDLIPDFIPVLGYLDDFVLIPAGVYLAAKMIPADVIAQAQQKADTRINGAEPVTRGFIIVVVFFWLLVVLLLAYILIGPQAS
jgi:uncharacterized membrane protein YkvA (DUF1232 family)